MNNTILNTPSTDSAPYFVLAEGTPVPVKIAPESLRVIFLEKDQDGNDIYSCEVFTQATIRSPYHVDLPKLDDLLFSDSDDDTEKDEEEAKEDSDEESRQFSNMNTLGQLLFAADNVLAMIDNKNGISEAEREDLSEFIRIDVFRYKERMRDHLELSSLGINDFYVPRKMVGTVTTKERLNFYWTRVLFIERAYIVYKSPQLISNKPLEEIFKEMGVE